MARLGARIDQTLCGAGNFTRFALATTHGLLTPWTWLKWNRFAKQLFFIGTMSVPVLAITGAFIGMILAIEGYLQFAAIGQEVRLGGVINISLTKQIGPVLAAVILAGRVGCSLTAELGSMRVTEQLDAMRAMAADPIRVLVCPRVAACVLMIPALTIVSNACGVFGGWWITTQVYEANSDQFWQYSSALVTWFDLFNGISKSVVFGLAIGLISCYKGFNCRPGAVGVGRATTDSFVTSFLAIVVINLVLAKLLNEVDLWRTGGVLRAVFT
ncbi:MAG: ABC transporter permease [Phycisphaera sp.]|nr:MAG: ABC transporter permease [Phycisphaera sp.]